MTGWSGRDWKELLVAGEDEERFVLDDGNPRDIYIRERGLQLMREDGEDVFLDSTRSLLD